MRSDIHRSDLYEYNKPKERTLKRLTEILDMGMEYCGVAQWGYSGVMSGLYIEKVWSYSDTDWENYIKWVKELVFEKTGKII